MRKIDFLMPMQSQHGVLHHFTKKLYEAFATKGFDCRLLEGDEVFTVPARDPPDLTIGFNGAPVHPASIFLFELIEKPHLCCLVDLSYRFFYLVDNSYVILGCNDRYSLELLHERNFERAFFLPPAADIDLQFDPKEERPYDIVLLATFIDFEGRKKTWESRFGKDLAIAMDQAALKTFEEEKTPFLRAFTNAIFERIKEGHSWDFSLKTLYDAMADLELYVRGKDRADLLESIHDAEVHVFDASVDQVNWKSFLKGKKKNIIFHEPVPFEENLEILKKSKIVLNSNPHTRNGAHERVFNALACGALPLTNENPYMSEIFSNGEDCLFYRHNELSAIDDKLNAYLKQEKKRRVIVERGREKVLRDHTWNNRADEIIHMLKQWI